MVACLWLWVRNSWRNSANSRLHTRAAFAPLFIPSPFAPSSIPFHSLFSFLSFSFSLSISISFISSHHVDVADNVSGSSLEYPHLQASHHFKCMRRGKRQIMNNKEIKNSHIYITLKKFYSIFIEIKIILIIYENVYYKSTTNLFFFLFCS